MGAFRLGTLAGELAFKRQVAGHRANPAKLTQVRFQIGKLDPWVAC